MASGGYRPGSGPTKGTKYKTKKTSKPRKMTKAQAEAEKIRQMLTLGTKAKAKFYQEFLIRVSKGDKLSLAEKKMMDDIAIELAEELGEEVVDKGELGTLTPLEYMLNIMNDPDEKDKLRKDRMAVSAAPYMHPRKGEMGTGKKDEKGERAKSAARGKFSPSRPPLALVK